MSKYTTEVRYICEKNAGLEESTGYVNIATVIEKSRNSIFDFSYPIFDENYRSVLETKILKHYYTREICCETVGLWKHFLDMRLNEIMPYYNKLYESELIEFNPLYDVDLTTDHNRELNGTRKEVGEFEENTETNDDASLSQTITDANKNDHWDLYQDTPQGGLTGVKQENYLTNVRHITDDTTGSTSTTNASNDRDIDSTRTGNNEKNNTLKDIEDYIQHVKGKSGGASYSKLLQEFRETFLNIDVMIINNLSDLFFNLW